MLLGVAGYFYLRSPHFTGSTVSSIEIKMMPLDSQSPDVKPLVEASITNARSCSSLFALLRSARFRIDHKCVDVGSFTIRYSDGKADRLAFLPGHDPSGYEFRFDGWLYRLPRERLYQVLQEAGVATAKMPELER